MTQFESNSTYSTAVLAGTTLVAFIFGGFFIWKEKRKSGHSGYYEDDELAIQKKKWRRIGEVDKILVYPLKAARHLSLEKANCTQLGLTQENTNGVELLDRSFILYDYSNERVTSNNYPKLVFVEIRTGKFGTVVLTYPGAQDLVVNLPSENEKTTKSFVMTYSREKLSTFDCGDEAARWFSRNLLHEERGFRLGYHKNAKLEPRSTGGVWEGFSKVYKRMRNHYFGAYSYMSSYLIMTQSSLEDLNRRLTEPVTDYHFRPNIVIKGTIKPYEEDIWDWIKIGDEAVFRGFKPCTRCTITTINPETGIKHPEQEPLRTLRTYRQLKDPVANKLENNSPVLGLYAGLHKYGTIRVGDPVYINDE